MTKNGTHAVNLSWEWMVQWLGLFKKWIAFRLCDHAASGIQLDRIEALRLEIADRRFARGEHGQRIPALHQHQNTLDQ